MNQDLLRSARVVAGIIGHRLQITIPSILAAGERFAARLSVTTLDGLPPAQFPYSLVLDGSVGIEGLPDQFSFAAGQTTGIIDDLTAVGPSVALVKARVQVAGGPAVSTAVQSNPAWVFAEPAYRLFWGDLHVHTEFSNCSGWRCLDPEWCYQYAQEISLLDFVAPADHLRGIASDPARWPRLQELARLYNQPGKFVTFLGFESSHTQNYGGDNNVYYLDDEAPYFWLDRDDMRGTAPKVHLKELWSQLDHNGKPYFTVPHHTGRAGKFRTWEEDYYDPSREPVFEIYSSWGSSEMRWSRLPISGGNNNAPAYFVDALQAGARFGVIASSDDHATLPGSVHHFRVDPFRVPTQNGYAHKGLTAVRTNQLTRESLFTALRRRDVYATTHARTLVDLRIGDASMGQELVADKQTMTRRQIQVRCTLDGARGAKVILMRNGQELERQAVPGKDCCTTVNEIVFQDDQNLAEIALRDAKYNPEPFVVYYARIEDSNGAHQWTSPIWLELPKGSSK